MDTTTLKPDFTVFPEMSLEALHRDGPRRERRRFGTGTSSTSNTTLMVNMHGNDSPRRRSVLGPPSLFSSSQRNSDAGFEGLEGLTSSSLDDIGTTIADLDFYYGLVKRQLLRYQSCTTGLFPDNSSDTTVGCVRSSIYAGMALWSLCQAYKRIDDDRGKTYELGQTCVLCLRGILSCWMRQSKRLEAFKSQQTPTHALHCKFHLNTGEDIYDVKDYDHLQIDVVSLYLLFLVQSLSSGLQVIYTMDEVHFIQNLVYYVERAYRTPDFGMWERGTVYNNRTREVNASSIGLAKAALEAINGCNLFGDKGASWSVVYVDIDAHNRNRSIFETLLPRESDTKFVDAALLPTISFPGFATHDQVLYEAAKLNVVKNLAGTYGFKRFSRDGFGTVLEDPNKRFYEDGKVQEFDHVECEWPMFFAFMVIDGVFKNNNAQVDKYQDLMRKRLAYNDKGDPVLPKYFYVPHSAMEDERANPGSQHRVASNDGSCNNDLHIWGQSMLIISDLLTSHLLSVHELDPIRRHLPSYSRPKLDSRYSAFEVNIVTSANDLVVQVVMIAESMRLQAVLQTYGIQTQTPSEIEPVQIWSQWEMVKVYQHLGRNEHLKLKGRPKRPIGSLGTSKVYRLSGQTILCYPLIFSHSDFYLAHDMALLTADIKSELQFVSRCWRLSGRPTVAILITENNMRDPQFPVMLEFLSQLRTGSVDNVKVRLGRLQNLIATSCLEHLDFLHNVDLGTPLDVECFKQLHNDHIGYQALTDIPKQRPIVEDKRDFKSEFENSSTSDILAALLGSFHLYGSIQMLGIILKREGPNFMVGDMSVTHRLDILNRKAGSVRNWAAVRYSSSLLGQMADSITPFVTQILANGKQVTVGTIGEDFTLFSKPLTPDEIKIAIYTKVQPYNVIAAVLQQELIVYCGKLIVTNPELFAGILKVRMGWVLLALDLYRSMIERSPEPIENCSPSSLRRLLRMVLEESKKYQLTFKKHLRPQEEPSDSPSKSPPCMTIFQIRQINGCLTRVPERFYSNLWDVLSRSPGGFIIGHVLIPQQPTLTNMKRTDFSFAHLIETALNTFRQPEYKQLVVELFCVLTAFLRRNPEIEYVGKFCTDTLISEAIEMFKKDQDIPVDETMIFFNAPVVTTSGYLARAIVNNVLRGSILTQSRLNVPDHSCPVQ
eukprot:TCALIF_01806-PB protein Name:"Similar to CG8475 Probable phosphorylase b kinase regulatory subunit beta (Drosophila melanogaster)" AED:0.09 eAED:0.09 QI:765/1/1/1/0.81/0.82/17/82/1165